MEIWILVYLLTGSATDKEPCPRGYYCESGTVPQPCSAGTYTSQEGAEGETILIITCNSMPCHFSEELATMLIGNVLNVA